MCPSFQATREEHDSTRGRANLLRAAMMGLLGPEGMTSQELYKVLDLCLSCHACKRECPSAVDVAKLKAEFLYGYYRRHGVSLRARLFADIARLLDWAQRAPQLANWALRGPGRWLMGTLGVDPRRQPPAIAPRPFSALSRDLAEKASPGMGGAVVFFHDTFTEHQHPGIGLAALKLLRAAGLRAIVLEDKRCCGRPAVSKGLLDKAKELAEHNLRLLAPYAAAGMPIVGVEPSCMVMLVEEYPSLQPGEAAERIAEQSMLLETFLLRYLKENGSALAWDGRPRKVLYHGHCQQKAFFGIEDTVALLEMIPGCRVEVVDAGCCGMAGSFGYEKEHYDLSIQLAEMALAPAVRRADQETIICASGASCREQIEHVTGRVALHPVEVMAEALAEG
jgi:Fe-S oxidoreductase